METTKFPCSITYLLFTIRIFKCFRLAWAGRPQPAHSAWQRVAACTSLPVPDSVRCRTQEHGHFTRHCEVPFPRTTHARCTAGTYSTPVSMCQTFISSRDTSKMIGFFLFYHAKLHTPLIPLFYTQVSLRCFSYPLNISWSHIHPKNLNQGYQCFRSIASSLSSSNTFTQ